MQKSFWEMFWREVFRRWVPALGMFGAGVAAIGAFWVVSWLTLVGALIAVLATMISTVRQAEFRDRLSDANAMLLQANEKLVRQAEDIAGSVTGGDSYAYASIQKNPDPAGRVLVNVVSKGSYPLYDVRVRVYPFADDACSNGTEGTYIGTTLDIGSLPAKSTVMLGFLGIFSDGSIRDANFFFVARNGSWTQELRGRNVDGEWLYAWRANWTRGDGTTKYLAADIPAGFPLGPDGQVDWITSMQPAT